MPPGASGDAVRIVVGRGVRAFADGFVALLLPVYLIELGFSAFAIGAIVTSTLIGTALVTTWVGMTANRYSRRRMLLAAAGLMAATGAAFIFTTGFWPLLVIAFVGTMNPTSGDASVFLPLEQAILSQSIEPHRRTALFARYSVIGTLAAAFGVLAASLPDLATAWVDISRATAIQLMFALYAVLGCVMFLLYRPLSTAVELPVAAPRAQLHQSQLHQSQLHQSRRLVYGLAALFAIDALGSGCLVQSLLALWLLQQYGVSVTTVATILFWSGVLSAASYLAAVPLAARIGLIRTMVFTHLPSNIFLMLVPFSPNLTTAIGLLLARSALSNMDVPTRVSYVMAVVTPEERPAAASLTAVPRPFAWAASSMLSGYLLTLSPFGWPLLIGGAVKAAYDILLLIKFQKVRPPEEAGAAGDVA